MKYIDIKSKLQFSITFFALFFSTLTIAQKIKIKKEELFINKTIVCNINNVGTHYDFLELNSTTPVLKIEFKKLNITADQLKQWLIVSNTDGSKKSQIEFEFLSFTLNTKKAISELLIKKYNLIGLQGFDTKKIEDFFATKRPNLTELYNNQMVALTQENLINSNYTGKLGIEVSDTGTVYTLDEINNTEKVVVGKISAPSQNSPGVKIKVIDLDQNLVAEAYFTGNDSYMVDTHNIYKTGTTQFSFKAKNKYMPATKAGFFTELVEQLYQRGYPLGHAIKEYKMGAALQEYNEAIAKSPNIYNVKGYTIDKEGNKIEGKIEMIFEKIYDPTGASRTDMKEENIGKTVTISHIKTNGQKKTTRLIARDESRFCVFKEDGTEICYQGFKVKKIKLGLADLGNSVGTLLKQYGYFKEIKKGKLLSLYQELPSTDYLIKLNTQDKAFRIRDAKSKRGKASLTEYLSGCHFSEITDYIDIKEEETLKNFISLYNTEPCK